MPADPENRDDPPNPGMLPVPSIERSTQQQQPLDTASVPSSPTRQTSTASLPPISSSSQPTSPTTASRLLQASTTTPAPPVSTQLRSSLPRASGGPLSAAAAPQAWHARIPSGLATSMTNPEGGDARALASTTSSSSASSVCSDGEENANDDNESTPLAQSRGSPTVAAPVSIAAPQQPTPLSYAHAAGRAHQQQQQIQQVRGPSFFRPLSSASGGIATSGGEPTLVRARSSSRLGLRTSDTLDGDDEIRVRDRGEALVRKRMKERKLLAQQQGRQVSQYESSTLGSPAPTPALEASPGGGHHAARDRSLSRSRQRERGAGAFFPGGTTPTGRDGPTSGYFPTPPPPVSPGRGGYQSTASYAGSATASEAGESASERGEPSLHEETDETQSGITIGRSGEERRSATHSERGSVDGEARRELDEDAVNEGEQAEEEEEEEEGEEDEGEVELTLRDRQDAINIEHPFGLPIWKPALYKKSRTITRNAESALHAIPSAAASRHLLPGNILWLVLFGWWLAGVFYALAAIIWLVELGGGRHSSLVAGLAWYIFWPFGKFVEGEGKIGTHHGEDEENNHNEIYGHDGEGSSDIETGGPPPTRREASDSAESSGTIRGNGPHEDLTAAEGELGDRVSALPKSKQATARGSPSPSDEREPLLPAGGKPARPNVWQNHSYGGVLNSGGHKFLAGSDPAVRRSKPSFWLGRVAFWFALGIVIGPLMLLVCALCWAGVITIPMAKLTWELLGHLVIRPLAIGFRPAPSTEVLEHQASNGNLRVPDGEDQVHEPSSATTGPLDKAARARLRKGQAAPTRGPPMTVLLCTYRAVGLQYYKYTVGGVNIFFINLLSLVFFVIFDAFVLLPLSEERDLGWLLNALANRIVIFVLSLASVIPLSYFIGMAVASISAQSSIGMGAVINATFGSIIEIVLYSIALMDGKGRLVEGSIVGSLLAGVLVMPGISMISGAVRRKEQRFNAKSAGVTSTMLIMAIIGTLTPTLFYQAYGSFELSCTGCPGISAQHAPDVSSSLNSLSIPPRGGPGSGNQPWMCQSCHYSHPDPAGDPFYQESVKDLMYFCAGILLLSYLIGLWFSLRTHASQIWQNPQQLLREQEAAHTAAHQAQPTIHPAHRASIIDHVVKDVRETLPTTSSRQQQQSENDSSRPPVVHRISAPHLPVPELPLPGTLTPEDFTRAVTAATVSALRHQQALVGAHANNARLRPVSASVAPAVHEDHDAGGGGHEGPAWSRAVSASVLLACTFLYAIIAEILVDVVDEVLDGSGIDEKFLGITLFALVPNTTEFMNAISFALNGNIALSMEIGSAYALQVCLLQIPAMVAFSAIYDPRKLGEFVDTFTLIFPQYDTIAIIFSIFLLTYTYIEARSNYHRGSILILAYLTLLLGFYYAPSQAPEEASWPLIGTSIGNDSVVAQVTMDPLSWVEHLRALARGLYA